MTSLTEVEILPSKKQFITKVDSKPVKIDHKATEESLKLIQRVIWREQRALRRTYDPSTMHDIKLRIDHLKRIVNDLQQVLEL